MLTIDQLKTEIRKCKKQKTLWAQDCSSWNSGEKVEELTNKINELENQLYELEFQQLESQENEKGLQG